MTEKSTARAFLVAGTAVLGAFYYGYTTIQMNPSQETIDEVFNLGQYGDISFMNGAIQALLAVGATLGALSGGPILQRMTIRKALIFTDIIGLVGSILSQVVNIYVLCLSRFIIGLAVGQNCTLVPRYILEYTPLHLRGFVGSINAVTCNIGVFAALLMGLGYEDLPVDNQYWRIVYFVPIPPIILRTFLLSFVFKDEPPSYLVHIGEEYQARKVLEKIYKEEFVMQQLNLIRFEEETLDKANLKYSDLFSRKYIRRLIVGCSLCWLQEFNGINSVMFYSTQIFKQLNDNPFYVNLLNLAVGIINICSAMFSGFLMRTFGRKSILLFGETVCLICLSLLAYFANQVETNPDPGVYKLLTTGFIFLYLIGFSMSFGPITWLYVSEILPEKGVSIAGTVNWTCVSIVALIVPIIISGLGIQYCFGIFAIVCVIGLFFLNFSVKETRGRNAVSIEAMFAPSDMVRDTGHTYDYDAIKTKSIQT